MALRSVFAVVVFALVALSGVYFVVVSQSYRAERERARLEARGAAEEVAAAFDAAFESLASAVTDSSLAAPADLWGRTATWAEGSGAPDVVRDVQYWSVADQAFVAAPGARRAPSDPTLAPWAELFSAVGDDWLQAARDVPVALVDGEPALVVLVVELGASPAQAPSIASSSSIIGVGLVRLDERALIETLLPAELAGTVDLETEFALRIRRAGTPPDDPPDAEAPAGPLVRRVLGLIASGPALRFIVGPTSALGGTPAAVMELRYRGGAAAQRLDRARWLALGIGAGALALVALATALALVSARRALDLKEAQMHFVAGISHELRTPISVILSASSNLEDGVVRREDRAQEYGRLIRVQAERLQGLIERTLTFASARAGQAFLDRDWVDVGAVVEAVAAGPSVPAGRLETHVPPDLGPLYADPDGVRVLVDNLVANALKYTDGPVRATVADGPEGVEIRVVDHGAGIPRDEQGRVFEPFFRGRTGTASPVGGSGLGLSLVRSVVESHRGTVRISDTPGGGATVTAVLPRAEPEAGETVG